MSQYELIDSGNCLKLERINNYVFTRPSPYAVWAPQLDQKFWNKSDIIFVRETDKTGNWTVKNNAEKNFSIEFGKIKFKIKLTGFGHIGLFPEQEENWSWIREQVKKIQGEAKVLNLFAYTGGSTIAAAQAGASVTHIDAAKNVVDWAKENAKENNLEEKPIRWITEDAVKFVERETKRGNKYNGIILDPPSFGRGPQGQVFKIENDLMPLFENIKKIMHKDCFILYTGHTPGFSSQTYKNQLEYLNTNNKNILNILNTYYSQKSLYCTM